MRASILITSGHTPASTPQDAVKDWSTLRGQDVEIHMGGSMTDRGIVDDVMADGSILWLANDGASGRRIIEHQPGLSIIRA